MTHPHTNEHYNVGALSHKAKCGLIVQRIKTIINNLTAPKHATLCC